MRVIKPSDGFGGVVLGVQLGVRNHSGGVGECWKVAIRPSPLLENLRIGGALVIPTLAHKGHAAVLRDHQF